MKTRVIPCLLLRDGGLYKTTRFRKPSYVGDPVNAVRIFNTKEVDELAILDIGATVAGHSPDFQAIKDIVSEAFMPVAYGGGVSTLEIAEKILSLGVEKVIVNSALSANPDLVNKLAERFGSQSIVVALDVDKGLLGREKVVTHSARQTLSATPESWAQEMERRGAGEILLTAVPREGTGSGYDLDLIGRIAATVSIPVIANGGAGKVEDFHSAVKAGATAVAAGRFFVYHGPHSAVLISYPDRRQLKALLP